MVLHVGPAGSGEHRRRRLPLQVRVLDHHGPTRAQPSLQWDLGDTGGTVAVRMPLHPVAIELLQATGPMAVSSANTTGHPPATTADEAVQMLGDAVSVYLDGGPSGEPVPSTIVDVTGDVPRVLRPGALDVELLREVAGDLEGPSYSDDR